MGSPLKATDVAYQIFDLGRTDFLLSLDFQKQIFLKVKEGLINSAVILCEYEPLITLGRATRPEEFFNQEDILRRGIRIYPVDRGGRITYHGPGQLVVYFIFNLIPLFKKDIHYFLAWLEDLGIYFLRSWGITANRILGLRGVWVENKKIISIGIGIRNWITYHGMSININNSSMENFRLIRPCGLDIEVTCLEEILKKRVDFSLAKERFLSCLREKLESLS